MNSLFLRAVLILALWVSGVVVTVAQNAESQQVRSDTTMQAVPATASVPMHPQEIETIGSKFKEQVVYGVGLQAGLLSGAGLVARMHMPNRMGAQIGFGVIGLGDNTYWDLGGEFQYTFDSDSEDRLYGLAGLGYYYASTNDTSSGNELDSPFRIGFGVGYEWFLGSRVVANASLPIIVFLGDERTQVFPLPQLALVYYFQ